MTDLALENIHIQYGRKTILTDVSLAGIPSGSVVGLLGANGVGKSSLLRAIAGLGPYFGSVRLDGTDLASLSRFDRSNLLGYLPQVLPQRTSLLAWEAVISACRAVRPDYSLAKVETLTETILERLHISHLALSPLNKLSGGQRQMVGLAQVLVKAPRLMLLDEPTSALDLRWQLSVFDVVKTMVREQDAISLIAIHDINLALRHCDQIVILAGGGILAHGPPVLAMSADILKQAYGIYGRVETCSQGHAFVISDHVRP